MEVNAITKLGETLLQLQERAKEIEESNDKKEREIKTAAQRFKDMVMDGDSLLEKAVPFVAWVLELHQVLGNFASDSLEDFVYNDYIDSNHQHIGFNIVPLLRPMKDEISTFASIMDSTLKIIEHSSRPVNHETNVLEFHYAFRDGKLIVTSIFGGKWNGYRFWIERSWLEPENGHGYTLPKEFYIFVWKILSIDKKVFTDQIINRLEKHFQSLEDEIKKEDEAIGHTRKEFVMLQQRMEVLSNGNRQ